MKLNSHLQRIFLAFLILSLLCFQACEKAPTKGYAFLVRSSQVIPLTDLKVEFYGSDYFSDLIPFRRKLIEETAERLSIYENSEWSKHSKRFYELGIEKEAALRDAKNRVIEQMKRANEIAQADYNQQINDLNFQKKILEKVKSKPPEESGALLQETIHSIETLQKKADESKLICMQFEVGGSTYEDVLEKELKSVKDIYDKRIEDVANTVSLYQKKLHRLQTGAVAWLPEYPSDLILIRESVTARMKKIMIKSTRTSIDGGFSIPRGAKYVYATRQLLGGFDINDGGFDIYDAYWFVEINHDEDVLNLTDSNMKVMKKDFISP